MARSIHKTDKANCASLDNTSSNSVSSNNTPIAPYVGFFGVGYVLANTVFMLIQTQIMLNAQLVMVLSIMIGAYISIYKFTKHQRRALSRRESNSLTLGSSAIIWLLTIIYFLAVWLWVFDTANRQVFIEMMMQRPLPLIFSMILVMLSTLIVARLSIWVFNRLLAGR